MKCATHILLGVGIGLLVMTSEAPAQEEQWLQYHSAREVSLLGGGMQSQALELSTEKPLEIKLPQFKSESPFFAKWSTPMVKAGHLWIALDRVHKQGPYDLLYIDSNANGHLDDETAATAYRMDQYNVYLGPVKVIFELEDGPVTYHLNFRFYGYDDRNRRLYASSGGWYEGDITVGAEKRHCVLFDYNANGTFDDKSASAAECDRIRIGKQGDQDIRFVGNYIEVDGALYQPEIARDGACITLTKAEDVKFGSIRLPDSITQFSACGQNGLFILKPEKGVASLPVGQYHIYDWAVEREDEKGTRWKLLGSGTPEISVFDVTEGKETVLSIGEPIVATLDASEAGGTHSFRHTMTGRAGERIELTCNGAQPQAPKVRIRSADGAYDRTYSFQYG